MPQFEPPLDSLSDLYGILKNGNRKIEIFLYSKNQNYARYANTSSDPSNAYYLLGRHLAQSKQFNQFSDLNGLIEVVEKDPQNVVIAPRIWLTTESYLKARYPLHIASGSLEADRLGWITEKNSSLVGPFNEV